MLPNPNDGDKEWVELYSSQTGVNLTGWKLEDGAGTILTLDQTTTSSFPVIELSSSRLNNDGDTVILKDATGTIVDRMTYGSFDDGNKNDNAPLPAKGQSLNRYPDGHDTNNDVVDWFVSKEPSKGAANSISTADQQTVTQVVTRTVNDNSTPIPQVMINEFVSDPSDGGQEWVEIINLEKNTVDLTDWTLEDGSGAVTNLSGFLGAADSNRYLIVYNPKGSLNNAGDAIVLRNASKQEVDRVTYGNWGTDQAHNAPVANDPNSVARLIDGFRSGNNARDFQVTTTPTLGKANIITAPASTIKSSSESSSDTSAKATPLPTVIISELFPNPVGEDHGIQPLHAKA